MYDGINQQICCLCDARNALFFLAKALFLYCFLSALRCCSLNTHRWTLTRPELGGLFTEDPECSTPMRQTVYLFSVKTGSPGICALSI